MRIVLALFISGLTATAVVATGPGRQREALHVCSDPNNLPFSNAQGAGFENKLAELLARHLGARLQYTWWAQRRGFVRNTLNAGLCDVVMGYPSPATSCRRRRPTIVRPTSSSAGVRGKLRVRSFDDPVLRQLRIGVQLVGDDGANAPPAHALSRRGLADHLVGLHGLRRLPDQQPAVGNRDRSGTRGHRRRRCLGSTRRILCLPAICSARPYSRGATR
jgi:mxaJ protein